MCAFVKAGELVFILGAGSCKYVVQDNWMNYGLGQAGVGKGNKTRKRLILPD